jgi:hypothetical protein
MNSRAPVADPHADDSVRSPTQSVRAFVLLGPQSLSRAGAVALLSALALCTANDLCSVPANRDRPAALASASDGAAKRATDGEPPASAGLPLAHPGVTLLGQVEDDAIPPDVLARVRTVNPDVLVVLGARVRYGTPGRNLYQRLRTALRLYDALDRRPALLLSGGKGEAVAMQAFLLAHGVPAAQMILERRSRTTVQNARWSMAILEREPERFRSALLVTTAVRHRGHKLDDHARRALADFVHFSRRVLVSAVSVNADPTIAPRMYVCANPGRAAATRRHHHRHHTRSHGARGNRETPASAGSYQG